MPRQRRHITIQVAFPLRFQRPRGQRERRQSPSRSYSSCNIRSDARGRRYRNYRSTSDDYHRHTRISVSGHQDQCRDRCHSPSPLALRRPRHRSPSPMATHRRRSPARSPFPFGFRRRGRSHHHEYPGGNSDFSPLHGRYSGIGRFAHEEFVRQWDGGTDGAYLPSRGDGDFDVGEQRRHVAALERELRRMGLLD